MGTTRIIPTLLNTVGSFISGYLCCIVIIKGIEVEHPTGAQVMYAMMGYLVYHVGLFTMATDELDGTRKRFNYKRYQDDNWPNWIFSFICVPLILYLAHEIFYYFMEWFGKDWKFNDAIFLLSGPLSDAILIGLKKLKKIYKSVRNGKD